jgi:hypothetical protein
MSNNFAIGYQPCPECRKIFFRDAPWKRVCYECWVDSKDHGRHEHTRVDSLLEEIDFLRDRVRLLERSPTTMAMDSTMLRRLLQLCHPDRHDNSQASVLATQYLLDLRAQNQP